MAHEIDEFLKAAVIASVFVAPDEHGLTDAELHEVAARAGYRPGETGDAIARVFRTRYLGQPKLRADGEWRVGFSDFNWPWHLELRDAKAVEFVRTLLKALAVEVGIAKARLAEDVIAEKAATAGFDRHAIRVAIRCLFLEGILDERDGLVGHARGKENWVLPSKQIESQARDRLPARYPALRLAHPLVQDVIARRTDGRAPAAEPLEAFEHTLGRLGHDRFRMWWVLTRTELRMADPAHQVTTVCVLSAALVEAALACTVRLAQGAGLMGRLDVSRPRTWKLADLARGARSGSPSVTDMLDERTVARCLGLNDIRQRIHAGALMEAMPTGPIPDLLPEQGRDARTTLDAVLRQILVWFDATTARQQP